MMRPWILEAHLLKESFSSVVIANENDLELNL
jgi:hypothetical protein